MPIKYGMRILPEEHLGQIDRPGKVVYSSACNYAELAKNFLNIAKSFHKFYIE